MKTYTETEVKTICENWTAFYEYWRTSPHLNFDEWFNREDYRNTNLNDIQKPSPTSKLPFCKK